MSTLIIDKAGAKASAKVVDKVFDKTDKGREEIASRKYRVAPRLRTLLVMIDGRRPLAELMTNFAALGVTEATFAELLEQQLIALVGAGEASLSPQRLPSPQPVDVPAAIAAPDDIADADRYRALAAFYNQTIKSTIGLRGIMLQLRAEKCACVEDFRAMRLVYLEAVYKAKGREMAVSLRDRLDQLLGGKPEADLFDPE